MIFFVLFWKTIPFQRIETYLCSSVVVNYRVFLKSYHWESLIGINNETLITVKGYSTFK